MFYKIHYNLVDICPPSYIQHANHISSITDHPLKYCNKNPLQINAYRYSFFPGSMNIWNRLPCSAVSHVIPSVDNFNKFDMPVISVMQCLYGAALVKISYNFLFITFSLSCCVCVFALLHSSIACRKLFGVNLKERKIQTVSKQLNKVDINLLLVHNM